MYAWTSPFWTQTYRYKSFIYAQTALNICYKTELCRLPVLPTRALSEGSVFLIHVLSLLGDSSGNAAEKGGVEEVWEIN